MSGKSHCNWREIKTYKNFCYIASDDVSPNTFQIVDMSALPSTVTLVYNGTELFEKGHTLWIDQDHLYVGSVSYSTQGMYSAMNVYSLEDPASPRFLRSLNSDCSFLNAVHDMHVRNDTIFASCGQKGMFVFKYDRPNNVFTQIGSYTDYAGSVANHSSYLTQNGKYLVFTDEAESAPIKVVRVENLQIFNPLQNLFLIPKQRHIMPTYSEMNGQLFPVIKMVYSFTTFPILIFLCFQAGMTPISKGDLMRKNMRTINTWGTGELIPFFQVGSL